MAGLPPYDNEAGLRALDAKCESPSSSDSTRTVVQLGKLPLARRMCYLQGAIFLDLPHLVRCLLQEALSVDTRFGDGWNETALNRCAIQGSVRALKALLNGGANHVLEDPVGAQPLYLAARYGHLECLRVLLEAGADANAADTLGNTPLIGAIIHKHVECVRALLPVSNLLQTSNDGENAFHASVHCASEECFELLLPLMEDVDVRTVEGVDELGVPVLFFYRTTLNLACGCGQMAMARALLKRGANRMALDNAQKSPLHWATAAGALACVILLVGRTKKPLLAPEQVNAKDKDGWTALHLSARSGNEKICGVLLSVGAQLDAKTNDGYTPLQLAQQEHPGNATLLELLAGNGPANLPGTVCDRCGKPAGRKMLACAVCQIVRYCDSACQVAAWPGHKKECEKEKAVREERTGVRIVSSSGGVSDATAEA